MGYLKNRDKDKEKPQAPGYEKLKQAVISSGAILVSEKGSTPYRMATFISSSKVILLRERSGMGAVIKYNDKWGF